MQNIEHPQRKWSPYFKTLFNLAMYASLGVVAFFVITEHRAHLYGILPYLFLLSCPLMHLFMHHDHGGHDEHQHQEESVDHDQKQAAQGGRR